MKSDETTPNYDRWLLIYIIFSCGYVGNEKAAWENERVIWDFLALSIESPLSHSAGDQFPARRQNNLFLLLLFP